MDGDDEHFNILQEQTDPDSQFHNLLLCEECLSNDEHYLENKDNRGRPE